MNRKLVDSDSEIGTFDDSYCSGSVEPAWRGHTVTPNTTAFREFIDKGGAKLRFFRSDIGAFSHTNAVSLNINA